MLRAAQIAETRPAADLDTIDDDDKQPIPRLEPPSGRTRCCCRLRKAGYERSEPAILQPAEPFLDLSGEDIRKSLYLTSDASG